MRILKQPKYKESQTIIIIVKDVEQFTHAVLKDAEIKFIREEAKTRNQKTFVFNRLGWYVFIYIMETKDYENIFEVSRKKGADACKQLNNYKIESTVLEADTALKDCLLPFAEGLMLANYQFLTHKTKTEDQKNSFCELILTDNDIKETDLTQLNIVVEAVYRTRNWVNEPLSHLNASKLAEEITKLGKEKGFRVEVLNRKKIESLKMGGLLAVNKGSIDPPTFSILEWKPTTPVNQKPIILVGKGVVFDTGGMNLKPGQFMNNMKMDMAGAATMVNALAAVAEAKLPVHLMALIPATDNRVNGNAYVTGDIVTMFDGTTVEVINTDAEGRMILADALSYAKKYNPELVIDAATLTGAAARAIGFHGIVAMGNDNDTLASLEKSGERTYERIAKLPFWEEYAEELKSDVADLKHLGGAEGGAIHAGKFLEHFTDYPYVHLDIAGVAFTETEKSYHGKGGTGLGVRMLFDFLKAKSISKKD
jgi:leucyl aminopeptidase